jgi:predicted small lipoprotein YifL
MIRLPHVRTALAVIALCAVVGGMLFLSACGQKGPLYVPAEQTDQEQEQSLEQS